MQKDDAYKAHQDGIVEMRKEVKNMRDVITRKDPTILQKSSKTLDKWMKWKGSQISYPDKIILEPAPNEVQFDFPPYLGALP